MSESIIEAILRERAKSYEGKVRGCFFADKDGKILSPAPKHCEEALVHARDADAEIAALRTQLDAVAKERDAADAELATAEADCAAMREALKDSRPSVALLGVCFDAAHVPDHYRETYAKNAKAHKVLLAEIDAALTRHTGQAIIDELSAARKVCEAYSRVSIHSRRGSKVHDNGTLTFFDELVIDGDVGALNNAYVDFKAAHEAKT